MAFAKSWSDGFSSCRGEGQGAQGIELTKAIRRNDAAGTALPKQLSGGVGQVTPRGGILAGGAAIVSPEQALETGCDEGIGGEGALRERNTLLGGEHSDAEVRPLLAGFAQLH